jgi:hypothetical protein
VDRGPGGALDLVVFQGAAQLAERPRFDLADALARDSEVSARLGQRASDSVVEAVADSQDLLLALAERAQQPIEFLVLELELDQALDRERGLAEVLARELLERLDAGAFVERAESGDEGCQALRARHRDVELARDLFADRLATQARAKRTLGARETAHLLEHLDRDSHRAGLLGQPAQDRLADPDRGVGGEVETALRLEPIHRHDQAEIAFLDEIEQRQSATAVRPRHVYHQAQVGEDNSLTGIAVAGSRFPRHREQALVRQQRNAADLGQVDVEQVALRLAADRLASIHAGL